MGSIQDFEEVRADGRVVDGSKSAGAMLSAGWPPCRVVELRWRVDGREVVRRYEGGVLATVVPGGRFVAVIEFSGPRLGILDAHGSRVTELTTPRGADGTLHAGRYGWFEPPRIPAEDVFGVVFSHRGGADEQQLDIAARTGAVLGLYPMRW